MRLALASVLYSALILSSPALAETAQSEWKEGRFRELSDWIYDGAGIRFSNCHLVRIDMGGLQAVPKCYVFNRGDKAARVKVRFVALDGEGSPVIDTTIVGLIDIQPATGIELSQYLPITADEWGRIETGRLQAWAATQ